MRYKVVKTQKHTMATILSAEQFAEKLPLAEAKNIIEEMEKVILNFEKNTDSICYTLPKKPKFPATLNILSENGYVVKKHHCRYHCAGPEDDICSTGCCDCGSEEEHTHDNYCNGWSITIDISSLF